MPRKSQFTEEQIIRALREVDAGAKPADVCRRLGVSGQTFYRWRSKFGGMDVSDAKRLRIVRFDDDAAALRTFEVAEQNGLWTLPSKDGYPADATQQMAEAATSLMDRKILEVTSTAATDHVPFGVVDPLSPNLEVGQKGVGTRVTISNAEDQAIVHLLGVLGDPFEPGGQLRLDDEHQDQAGQRGQSQRDDRSPPGPRIGFLDLVLGDQALARHTPIIGRGGPRSEVLRRHHRRTSRSARPTSRIQSTWRPGDTSRWRPEGVMRLALPFPAELEFSSSIMVELAGH